MSDIVEKLRLERLERSKQRQLQLEKLELESKVLREQRRKDREAVREKEKQLNDMMNNLTSKSIQDSIQVAKLRSNDQLFQQDAIDRQNRDKNLMRELDRGAFNVRSQRVDELISRRKARPRPPSKFKAKTAEFYGVDFSVDLTVIEKEQRDREKELSDIASRRGDLWMTDPEHSKLVLQQGRVMIEALKNSVTLWEDQKEVTHDQKSAKDSESKPIKIISEPDHLRQKRPEIDFSSHFPVNVGQSPGISIFIIDNLEPVEIEPVTFCIGDCYIVLHTYEHEGRLRWDIFQWIGSESEIDKKACSAIFSVGLRQLLNADVTVKREECGSESSDFQRLIFAFGIDLEYENALKSKSSALFTVQKSQFPFLMYKCMTRRKRKGGSDETADYTGGDLYPILVSPSLDSVQDDEVAMIDHGERLYQLNGGSCPLSQRVKTRLLCQNILKHERPNRNLQFEEFERGLESEDLKQAILLQDSFADCERNDYTVNLYNFQESNFRRALTSSSSISDYSVFSTNEYLTELPSCAHLASDSCCVLDCTNEIFLWIGKKSSRTLRLACEAILINKILPICARPPYLNSVKLIEGIETEIFKLKFSDWNSQKRLFTAKSSDSASLIMRPPIPANVQALFTKPSKGNSDIDENRAVEEFILKADMLLQNIQVYIFDLITKAFVALDCWKEQSQYEYGHMWSEETYCFIATYKITDLNEKTESNSGDSQHLSAEAGTNYECIVYFWQGRKSSSLAWLVFQFHFRPLIEQSLKFIVDSVNFQVVKVDQGHESLALIAHFGRGMIIHQGSRPNSNTTVTIKSPDLMKSKIYLDHLKMFQFKVDGRSKAVRAIEVCPTVDSLCTRDIFCLLANPQTPNLSAAFLWIGKGASKEEERLCAEFMRRILNYFYHDQDFPVVRIREGDQFESFWSYLAPNFGIVPGFRPRQGQGYYFRLPPPRMFECSTSDGSFTVKDFQTTFTVYNLKSNCILLLDSGPTLGRPHPIYVWIGSECSDVLLKLSKKSVEAYIEHMNDGRTFDSDEWNRQMKNSSIDTVSGSSSVKPAHQCDVQVINEGCETLEFKAFFHGWGGDIPETILSDRVDASPEFFEKWKNGGLNKPRITPSNFFLRTHGQKSNKK